MILAALKSYKEDKVQLSDLIHYVGQLQHFNIEYKRSSSGARIKYKFLALNINGLNQTLGVYRPEQQYEDFLTNIKKGDTVSIYFRKHSKNYQTFISGISFNSDIYQLCINNKLYINAAKVKSDHSKGNNAALIGGIFIYLVTIIGAISKVSTN